jgi:hypothetical protein
VLGLTADHGAIPDPKISGAFQISSTPIGTGINQAFDHDGDDVPVVELIQPTQLFIDEAELRQNGGTLDEVARWIMGLTEADTAGPGVEVPAAQAGEKVFQAAFPSALMENLDCLPEATE